MSTADKSKRSFVKRVAVAVGFVAAADYFGKLLLARSNSIGDVNNKSAHDVSKQRKAWMQKQMVLMTDDDKKQMLDEILENHNKFRA